MGCHLVPLISSLFVSVWACCTSKTFHDCKEKTLDGQFLPRKATITWEGTSCYLNLLFSSHWGTAGLTWMKIIYIEKETNKHLFIPLYWSLKLNADPFLLVTTSIIDKSFGVGDHAGKSMRTTAPLSVRLIQME